MTRQTAFLMVSSIVRILERLPRFSELFGPIEADGDQMLFLSIIFAILVPQAEQKGKKVDSFKDKMIAVELLQKMEGEWEFEKKLAGEKDVSFPEQFGKPLPLFVSDYAIKQTVQNTEVAIWKIIGFDADLNALKIKNVIDSSSVGTGLVTVKDDKLLIVHRRPKLGKAPVTTEPNEKNIIDVWRKR